MHSNLSEVNLEEGMAPALLSAVPAAQRPTPWCGSRVSPWDFLNRAGACPQESARAHTAHRPSSNYTLLADQHPALTLKGLFSDKRVRSADVLTSLALPTNPANTRLLLQCALLTVKRSQEGSYISEGIAIMAVVARLLNLLQRSGSPTLLWHANFQLKAMEHEAFSPKWLEIASEAQARLSAELALVVEAGNVVPDELANPT